MKGDRFLLAWTLFYPFFLFRFFMFESEEYPGQFWRSTLSGKLTLVSKTGMEYFTGLQSNIQPLTYKSLL